MKFLLESLKGASETVAKEAEEEGEQAEGS